MVWKGCGKFTDQDVINLFNGNPEGFLNKYMEMLTKLAPYNFKANEKRGNAKSFALVYQKLLKDFENTNPTAFEKVEQHYEELKESNPTKTL